MPTQLFALSAGIISTILWGINPVYVAMLKTEYNALEIFYCASLASLFLSCVGFVIMKKRTKAILNSENIKTVVKNCAIAGLFISIWYIAFYSALSENSAAQVTILSYTWPLFAILGMRLISPSLQRRLQIQEYPILTIVFLGAAMTTTAGQVNTPDLFLALTAAISAGFFIPFISLAVERIRQVEQNRLAASFFAVSLSNLFSFLIATPILLSMGNDVIPQTMPSGTNLVLFAIIGMGTYLMAEVIWCMAINIAKSPSIACLPYFTPVFSIIFFTVFMNTSIQPSSILGMILIIAGNILLGMDIFVRKQEKAHPKSKLTIHKTINYITTRTDQAIAA